MKRYKVANAGFQYSDINGCCNAKEKISNVKIPDNTNGSLIGNWNEAFRSGKYIGSSGDGMPKRIIKADDGNYYGLGYGFELTEILTN